MKKSNDNKKIEVVDENSGIEFINDHYKKVTSSDIDKYDFDFDSIIDDNYKKKYTSIFNPIKTITNGFKKLFNFPILKKILLFLVKKRLKKNRKKIYSNEFYFHLL